MPTLFTLHVIACDDNEHSMQFIKNNYKLVDGTEIYNCDDVSGDWVETVLLDGERIILAKFTNLKDREVFAHELVHVKYHLHEMTNIELTKHSQEWEACFTEYLFKQMITPNYQKFKKS